MVEKDHNKDSGPDSRKLTRRSFASVVGLSVFGTPGVLKSTTPTTVTIPFLLSGDEVVKEKEVPKDWKDHVEHATKANKQAQEDLLSENAVKTVGLVGSEKTYGGNPGLKIRVEREATLTPDSQPIPQQQDGIEIEVTDAPSRGIGTGTTASECIVNDGAMNGIPGGVEVQGSLTGTSTCKVSKGGSNYLMTAAHLWGSCPSGIDGSTASHNSEEIGEIAEYDANLDYALLNNTGSQSWESGVDCEKTPSEIPSSISLNGVVSKMGLKTEICMPNCSNRDPIHQMGVVSGVTKGGLQMIDASAGPNCVDYGNNGIRVDAYNVEGDSGGPFFYKDGSDYYLAGIQQTYIDNYPSDSGCNGGENAPTGEGVAAFHLKNELGIEPA